MPLDELQPVPEKFPDYSATPYSELRKESKN